VARGKLPARRAPSFCYPKPAPTGPEHLSREPKPASAAEQCYLDENKAVNQVFDIPSSTDTPPCTPVPLEWPGGPSEVTPAGDTA
jgi:hypothetical protein